MFFVSRHFFERTKPLERKTLEKALKSTLWGNKIHPESVKIRSKREFSQIFDRFFNRFVMHFFEYFVVAFLCDVFWGKN